MLLYTINKDKISKMLLPEKIFGAYSLVNLEEKVIATVEENGGKWHIHKNSDIELYNDKVVVEDIAIELYKVYEIKQISTGIMYKIVTTPYYDASLVRYNAKVDRITIGLDPSDTIVYKNDYLNSNHVVLTKKENYWVATTNYDEIFINDKTFKTKNVLYGDYINIYGLKLIVLGNTIIMNNPNNSISINASCFEENQNIPQNIVYEREIDEDTPQYSKDEYFFKAPRFKSLIEPVKIKLISPPQKPEEQSTPAILIYGPQITMLLASGYSGVMNISKLFTGEATLKQTMPSLISLTCILLTSLMWPTIIRLYEKKKLKRELKKRQEIYKKYIEAQTKRINEIKSFQQQVLIENNISLEECQSIIYNRKRNLWERNIENEDFLSVRLGIGYVPCRIDLECDGKYPTDDELNVKYNELIDKARYIENCPMDLSILSHKDVAIVGNSLYTKYFLDSIFLQILTFHSYSDLKIVTITNKENNYLWEYLKIAPHSWDEHGTFRYYADNIDELNELSQELEKEFNNRYNPDAENTQGVETNEYLKHKPYYLIFVDDLDMARNIPIVRKCLQTKPNVGFSIIIRNDRLSNLPSEIKTFVNVDPENSGLFESELIVDNQKQFKPEFNKTIDLYGCAQKLANIPVIKGKAKYELPKSISFLSMYKVGKVSQLNSLDRWKNNNPSTSLSVPVGINQDGELFKMDAHEKAYGPHGLIAGMTGSGKSEWIITYILSLAVNYHPDEVQFVLIDYKGGGLALSFENKELGIKLPHLAGTITNLDKSAINRALTSIEAELKRRQKVFNEAREKLHESSINIYKYQQFYRKGLVDEPMSHLFIISDEFAELKSQEPEFLDQLVSTARIGRSLGVHLILATQKPSGVVNDQIWSNSRFKVCLRVQDTSDSQEMIKTPDAAMLKTVGAFYLQVGYNELYTLGQSAWAGAKYFPSDIVKKDIDQSLNYIDATGTIINTFDESILKKDQEPPKNQGEELLNIVSYISNLSKETKVVGRQLWLPNINEVIYLSDIKKKYNHKPIQYNLTTVVGEYDDPELQLQSVYKIDLANNTAIYGEVGSGKENLIASLLWSSISEHTPQEVNYYIIDFGAETLRMFYKYPHVGEIAFSDNVDIVAGIIDMVAEEIQKRKDLFADFNGNYDSYLKESGKSLPRWVIVINSWDVFQEQLPRAVDIVTSLFRDSIKMGISFLVSTSNNSAIRLKTAALFQNKLVLHQSDASNYRSVLNCSKKLIPQNALSRGIGILTDGKCVEFQGAYICELDGINQYIRKNGEAFANYYKTKAKQLPRIPDTVTSEDLVKYITDLNNVPIGYSVEEKMVYNVNFNKERIYPICVDDLKKNIGSVYGLINILTKIPGNKIRVIDLDNIYNGLNIDVKCFKEEFDAVMVAFLKDAKMRNTNQEHAINIILGSGLAKTMLNKIGLDAYNEMMSTMNGMANTSIILIDTYERMKKIKIEPWYSSINTSEGMWIGNGIASQNLFSVNEISMEHRKMSFAGQAFVIKEAKYTMIKTVLDGED